MREDEYFGNHEGLEEAYIRRNEVASEDEYQSKVISLALNFEAELYDIAIRYNLSLLGEVERNKGLNGPVKCLVDAIAKIQVFKEINLL